MKMSYVVIAVIIAGVIAAGMIFLPKYISGTSISTQNSADCRFLEDMSRQLDIASYDCDRLEKGILNNTAVNAEQMRRWKEDLIDLRRQYNDAAQEYNRLRKEFGCKDLPETYFIMPEIEVWR